MANDLAGRQQARLEVLIARAHRAVWTLKVHAGGMANLELADDLEHLERYLAELGADQLRRRPHGVPLRGQLSLSGLNETQSRGD